MRILGPRADSTQRADVNYAAAAGLAHQARALLAAEEYRLQVYRMNEIPIRFSDVHRIEGREARGVVHQAIEAALVALDLAEHGRNLGYFLQVRAEQRRVSALRSRLSGCILRFPVMDQHTR